MTGNVDPLKRSIAALCMLLSGGAALVYQIAWSHQLSVAIGTAQSAVAIMLASFLGGLALGGWIASRWLRHGLDGGLRYAQLELFIAIWAASIPFVFPLAQALLIQALGSDALLPPDAGMEQVGVYLAIVLCLFGPPTVAMGATLPILVRAVRGEAREVADLYAMNTAGAAAGALLAGFILVPALGLGAAGRIAALANLVAALLAWSQLRVHIGDHERADDVRLEEAVKVRFGPVVSAGIAGIATFALEVFWTRLLAIPFGGTTRGFAFMLGLWLGGLAIGGCIAVRRQGSAALALLVGALLSLGGYLAIVLTGVATKVAIIALFPGAVAFGLAYPRFVAAAGGDPARSAGLVYAANTAGAVIGALLAGHVLLETFGFGGTLLCALALLMAAAMAATDQSAMRFRYLLGLIVTLGMLFPGLPSPDALLAASTVDRDSRGERISLAVGRVATVEVRQRDDGIAFRSDGLPEALVPRYGSPPVLNDQHWLTALPALARPEARNMMVVGLGGGVSLESVPTWIRSIDVVEIEQQVILANQAIAADREVNPLADPRIKLVHNDARNALLRTAKRYDIIVSQPSHPWTAGSANLYSHQFVALSKAHLNDGGLFVQWMNASFVDTAVMRAFLATLAANFDFVRIYEPVPFNLILVASDRPIAPERGFQALDAGSKAMLDRAGLLGPADLSWSLLMDEQAVHRAAADQRPISDDLNAMAFQSGPGRGELSRIALDALAGRTADARAADYYSRLRLAQAGLLAFTQEPEAALIASARARGRAGDFVGLSGLDRELGAFDPTQPGYAEAFQLRAAWRINRIAASQSSPESRKLVGEALAIVDAALRVETTPDLLMQRATLAQVLGDWRMLAETALTFADIAGETGNGELNSRRANALLAALQGAPKSAPRDRAIAALSAGPAD